ncbi:nucleotidyltransferase domain-containing protein [Thermoactinospora rubra]|uniref:nucleotidyltransferase domain-containing protein n=1 Tax=Thermoactinospora rubra TaxID=1088767 RepID=UPI001301C774|nr:nucleotidyltransferase domain-containing protein [Thermoactinospora rubra]
MAVPGTVQGIVDSYLHLVDAEASGLVEGLYLEGSVALGDFRPRTSDIDFVAVAGGPLDEAATAALERAHTRLSRQWPKPFFDGVYVTWDDLHRDPAAAGSRPGCHEHRFTAEGSGPPNPVTWHTLAWHGVACRGPQPTDLDIWIDVEALKSWCDRNLDQYWRRLLDRASQSRSMWGLATMTPYGALWIVSGVCRIHYTLATGGITSKEGACRHALGAFPEPWHRIINECLRVRQQDRACPTLSGATAGLMGAPQQAVVVPDTAGSAARCPGVRRSRDRESPSPVLRAMRGERGPGTSGADAGPLAESRRLWPRSPNQLRSIVAC